MSRPLPAFILVFLALGIPRFLALDRFATPDEHLWVTRSTNFYCALRRGDWAHTFQRQHPGVTTMWAGTMGFLATARDYGTDCRQIDKAEHEQVLREHGYDPLDVLVAGRFFAALLNVCALSVAFLYTRRLVGPLPALVGFLLIAFDPFHVAHSRLLHLDGLLSSLMLLAVLAFSGYLRTRRAADLVVSGIATGLSCLSKSCGVLLLPLIGLLELLHWLWRRRSTPALSMGLWCAVATGTFVVLWPAMWVEPYETIVQVGNMATEYASEGHSNPLFFDGTLYADGAIDASVLHYYPLTYLWRSTPIALLGLIAAGIAAVAWHTRSTVLPDRQTILSLVLAVLCFAIVIHLGAKKFDRYLLPIFAPLDLVAGMGWAALARWLSDLRFSRLWRFSGPLALCAAIVLQLFGTMRTYPYYLSYYNPLLGGNTGAQRDMMIGWGEGLDQAARYLNRRPNADQLHVVSWYAPGCFSYFFQGASTAIPGKGFADPSLQDVLNADYVVTYSTHQAQRQTPAALLDYLYRQEPEHTVYINGIEYVRVYGTHDDGGNGPEYEVAGAVLGDEIELESYQISDRDLAAGQTLVVSLSWQALEALHEPCKVFVHLLDSSGKLVAQHDGEPVAWHSPTDRWSAGEQLTDRHGIPLPEDLSPGEYSLVAGMYRHSGERLPISQRGEPVGMRTNWVR